MWLKNLKQGSVVFFIVICTIFILFAKHSKAMVIDYVMSSSSYSNLLLNAFITPNDLCVRIDNELTDAYVDDDIIRIDDAIFNYELMTLNNKNRYSFYSGMTPIGVYNIERSEIEFRGFYEDFPLRIGVEETSSINHYRVNEVDNSNSNMIEILTSIAHTYQYFKSYIQKFILSVSLYLLSIIIIFTHPFILRKKRTIHNPYTSVLQNKNILYTLLLSIILFLFLAH